MTDTASPGTLHAGHGADHRSQYGHITQPDYSDQPDQRAHHDQLGMSDHVDQPEGLRRTHRLASLGMLLAVAVGATACSSGSSPTASSVSAASSSPTAKAKSHGARPSGASGVVTAVSSNTLTIHTKSATSTVGLASTTKYKEGGTDVTVSDLVVGDHVKIRLAKKSATPTAAIVIIVPPSVTGTVGALSAAGFTLSAAGGKTDTVTTSSSTVYRSGKQITSASSLHNGVRVRISGQLSPANGSISAATITILPAKKT